MLIKKKILLRKRMMINLRIKKKTQMIKRKMKKIPKINQMTRNLKMIQMILHQRIAMKILMTRMMTQKKILMMTTMI